MIDEASPADVEAIVAIHRDALADDVLPGLGPEFLERYYARARASEAQHLAVCRDAGGVVGFYLLETGDAPVTELLTPRAVLRIASLALTRPLVFCRGLVQLVKRRPVEGCAEIAFIAVDPAHQGAGIGSALIEHATRASAERGFACVVTKTSNERLAAHYQRRRGATVVHAFRILGERYQILRWPSA